MFNQRCSKFDTENLNNACNMLTIELLSHAVEPKLIEDNNNNSFDL